MKATRSINFKTIFFCFLVFALVPVFFTLAIAGSTAGTTLTDDSRYLTASRSDFGCTNVIVGRKATIDGSTIGSYTSDYPRFGRIRVVPGKTYPPGSMMPVYYKEHFYPDDLPVVKNYKFYQEYLAEKPKLLAQIPQVKQTYRCIVGRATYEGRHCGGMNEYGLTIGETTTDGRPELMNPKGLFYAYGDYMENGLITLGLQRAKTAREAIQVMGSLAEKYGYRQSGEHFTVIDGKEAWAFEIFGAGSKWTPDSGKPGAVWCAQRIPDDHVGVSANRSRIGEIDLKNPDFFMASPNIYAFGQEMGWWKLDEPFVFYKVYGIPGTKFNSLREWRVLSLAAPSLKLDPNQDRFPFSVKPDKPLSVQDVITIHRDAYEGTPYDITANPAFLVDGKKSPLATSWGSGLPFEDGVRD
ncbi:MAG: C69 family dipeptidase, partial [Deltaproteobacteria bacterium]|nr:C69 family dipeptidase [Deltaproteobacteria bacterium]